MLRRLRIVCSSVVWVVLLVVVIAQTPEPAASGQAGYVPIAQLPSAQQLPAAPFLIGAYAFIWLAVLAYLWSIWRRLALVQREIRVLDARSHGGGSA